MAFLINRLRDFVFPKYDKKPPNVSSTNSNILYFLEGGIITEFLGAPPAGQGMRFRQTISATNPRTCQGRSSEGTPPYHYHPKQTERWKVESGTMGYVINGVEGRITAGNELVSVPGERHTWWVHVDPNDPQDLVVVLSAEPDDDGMTEAWFRNLYAAFENGPPRILHLFVLLDAGDVILATPPKPIGWLLNVILGRFIGGWIAGYKAYDDMYTYPGSTQKKD